ncbi:30S ribosomal protein S14 [Candidatus Woesearchaeota archaeon]|nr:30S ribosomal protein S14 [Candidatus Woesearchaeota archaeon]
MLKQLKSKPQKMQRYLKFNKPKERKFGKGTRQCVRCGSNRGHIAKYGIRLCRRCFRDTANKIGFKKYN